MKSQAETGMTASDTRNQTLMQRHRTPVEQPARRHAPEPRDRGLFAQPSSWEVSRRARLIAFRMHDVLDVLRLNKAARSANMTRHAFIVKAIEAAVAAQLASGRGASNAVAEARVTVSGSGRHAP